MGLVVIRMYSGCCRGFAKPRTCRDRVEGGADQTERAPALLSGGSSGQQRASRTCKYFGSYGAAAQVGPLEAYLLAGETSTSREPALSPFDTHAR